MPSWTNDRRRALALVAIFVYSIARGEETEHYKIKQPNRQKSPLFIESRLRNFYCDENTTTYDISGPVRNRWNALKESINSAHTEYERLEFNAVFGKKVISGPPFFAIDVLGEQKIILPLNG